MEQALKPWPLYGYAPGNYLCKCLTCEKQFEGDKRAWNCLECAVIRSKRAAATIAPAGEVEPVAISVQDPAVILAGMKQFGLASDGSDLRDLADTIAALQAEIERLRRERDEAGAGHADARDNFLTMQNAANKLRIRAEAELSRIKAEVLAVVGWYGEQARLARLIHSEGDAGRHALAEDGGKRARALAEKLRSDQKEAGDE